MKDACELDTGVLEQERSQILIAVVCREDRRKRIGVTIIIYSRSIAEERSGR